MKKPLLKTIQEIRKSMGWYAKTKSNPHYHKVENVEDTPEGNYYHLPNLGRIHQSEIEDLVIGQQKDKEKSGRSLKKAFDPDTVTPDISEKEAMANATHKVW